MVYGGPVKEVQRLAAPKGGEVANLGTHKRPAVVRVRSTELGEEIVDLCNDHGWQVIVGIEPGEPEDLSDVEKLMRRDADRKPETAPGLPPKISGNDYCPCRSGKKYKKRCGAPALP